MPVRNTTSRTDDAAELAWALLMASARDLKAHQQNLREGVWYPRPGTSLEGATLGIVGFGRVGKRVAELAAAFRMRVLVNSAGLSADEASARGVKKVSRTTLFECSDFVSIHLRLSKSGD